MDGMTAELQCDIELQLSGPNTATVDKWAADALRRVADQLEAGQYQSGIADVKDNVGKSIGRVYVDYSATDEAL
ncbi:MAG: hypothetical protein JNM13_04110 [Hyphomicrobiaceae bacterium]|nr:hypothetical protein [Hyphomicrobiaceae bacterium]